MNMQSRDSLVSPMNSLFKNNFQVKLSHQLDEICLAGGLAMNMQPSTVSLTKDFFKTIF